MSGIRFCAPLRRGGGRIVAVNAETALAAPRSSPWSPRATRPTGSAPRSTRSPSAFPGVELIVADDASDGRDRRGRAHPRRAGREPRQPARQGRQRDGGRGDRDRPGGRARRTGVPALRRGPRRVGGASGPAPRRGSRRRGGSRHRSLPRAGSAAASGSRCATRRWAIERLCGYRAGAPISGQRALSPEAMRACFPFAPGYGMEIGITVDVVRAGLAVREIELDLEHRATGKSFGGFLHRGRQLRDFTRVYRLKRKRDRLRAVILAIDQGTTGSTCLVFDGEGRIAGRSYSEFQQHFPRPGLGRARRSRDLGGHPAGGDRGDRRRRHPGRRARRDRDHQPARDGGGLGSRHRRAGAQRARLAGPAHRCPLRRAARRRATRTWSASAPAWCSTRTSPGRRSNGCSQNSDAVA